MKNLDEQITNLRPCEQLIISSFNNITVHVERSSNGKNLRYVRTFSDGSFSVFKTCLFY